MNLFEDAHIPPLLKPRVLVVDDDPDHVELTARIIQISGAEVRTAADGDAGFEAVKRFHPDVIIADLAMPFRRGDEMLIELRNAGFQKPIIILTGHGELSSAIRALRYDAFDFLEKPISRDLLLSVVRNAIRMEHIRLYQHAIRTVLAEALENVESPKNRETWAKEYLQRATVLIEKTRRTPFGSRRPR